MTPRFALLVAVCFIVAACQSLGTTPRRMTLPLHNGPDGSLNVQAEIAGHGPFILVLDTGSEFSALKARHVRRLGLGVQPDAYRVHGLFAAREAGLTHAVWLTSGKVALEQPFLVLDDTRFGALSGDGLFGVDSFAPKGNTHRYTQIDLSAPELTLSTHLSRTESGAVSLWTRLHGDMPGQGDLLAVDVTIDGVRGRALLDTGLNYSLINTRFAQALEIHGRHRQLEVSDINGDDGRLTVAGARNVRAMGLRWHRVPMLVHDAAAFEFLGWNDTPAALIGRNMLRSSRLIIDHDRRRIAAVPGRNAEVPVSYSALRP